MSAPAQVIKTHHIGISVRSLERSLAAAAAIGIDLDLQLEVEGEELAVGNGLTAARMRLAFCSGPPGSLELIENMIPGSRRLRSPGEPGHARLTLPARAEAGVEPFGIGVGLEPGVEVMQLAWTSPAPDRTAAVMVMLGLDASAPAVDGSIQMRREDLGLHLLPAAPDTGLRTPMPNDLGRVHICFEVGDLEAVHARLSESGVRFVSELQLHEESGLRWVFFRDPGGVGEIELLQVPEPS